MVSPTWRISVFRGAAIAGMVGPALFALLVVTLTAVQYSFMIGIGWHPIADPASAWPSGLALGPYGWVQSLNFAISGLSLILFALGLQLGMDDGSRVSPILLLLSGVGMMLLAFKTDPIIRTGPRTLHGWVHDLSFVPVIASLVPSFFFLWRRMERNPLWKGYARYTLITGLLAISLFLLPGPAVLSLPYPHTDLDRSSRDTALGYLQTTDLTKTRQHPEAHYLGCAKCTEITTTAISLFC